MTTLGREIHLMQNPALGAVLLWRFASAYAEAQAAHSSVPLPLLFVVLPAVLHEPTAAHIRSTQQRSGLRVFASKFTEGRPSQLDLLIQLHDRALRWRSRTLEALRVGIAMGLLRINADGTVSAGSNSWTPNRQSKSVKNLSNNAEKMAGWCAALSLDEVALTLHLRF
jgi:Family of unknown function (DUF6521)